jgi:hypothetical protein
VGLLALAAAGAVVIYLLRPGAVTDDTYAFLDWGRDLRHGFLPLLEHRTFQPLPILLGGFLSLLGSAAPTATVLLSLAALVLLAAAGWRISTVLGFAQPAPALAAALLLLTPLEPVLALSAYNNLPFATLVLWALACELERRSAATWALLVLAGLTRPEAWLFLLAYGALCAWRARDRPSAPRLLAIAALALAPIAIWGALEWGLFGDPLYSLHNTTGPAVASTHTNSPSELWFTLRANLPPAALIASALGALALAALVARRTAAAPAAAVTLAATVLAGISIVILAGSNFNVPGRDFSLLVALLCVLAALGAGAPARLLASRTGHASMVALALGVACAALLVGFSARRIVDPLRSNLRNISVSHDTGSTLSAAVSRSLPLLHVHAATRHSVAMLGAVENSQLAWLLGVPFNAVTDHVEPQTRLIVQPSHAVWAKLRHRDLTDRTRSPLPHGWHVLVSGQWEIYAANAAGPGAALSGS